MTQNTIIFFGLETKLGNNIQNIYCIVLNIFEKNDKEREKVIKYNFNLTIDVSIFRL